MIITYNNDYNEFCRTYDCNNCCITLAVSAVVFTGSLNDPYADALVFEGLVDLIFSGHV